MPCALCCRRLDKLLYVPFPVPAERAEILRKQEEDRPHLPTPITSCIRSCPHGAWRGIRNEERIRLEQQEKWETFRAEPQMAKPKKER